MTPRTDVAVVVGTRPEIIKMAPVIRSIRAADDLTLYLAHTNQHYDEGLSDVFFETLELPIPDVNFSIGSASQAEQTAAALTAVESVLTDRNVNAVLAQGDTNAVLSTALAASKLPVPFGHVEAGIRSFDRTMPEEVNRVVADHVADALFAPTDVAGTNLRTEGITEDVHVTGNTIVEACREHSALAECRSSILETLSLEADAYAVATIHRPRNTDDHDRLERIATALDGVEFPVVLPAHPRTTEALAEIGFEPSDALTLIDPLDYLDFLRLLTQATVVVTDSGGIQEEASILEVPCLTVRPNTERPETVDAGVNELLEPEDLETRLREVYGSDTLLTSMTGRPDLYGDGHATERIVDVVRELRARW